MTIANVHIQQVLLRRGNTAQASSYTGPVGEVIIDTDLRTIRVQDGITPGGYLATSSDSSATPPAYPRENMLWYDTTGGRLYIYYHGAWIDASPAGDLLLNANVAQLTSDVANVEIHVSSLDANIGAFETTINNSIGALDANIGAFEIAVNNFENLINANVGTFETTVTSTVNTINSNINTLNVTIAGFEAQPGPTSDAWVDDAPPDISNVGALWYDADGGRLYVQYDSTWVDASPNTGSTSDLGKFVFDSDGDNAFIQTTNDAGASPDRYNIVLVPGGEGNSSITIPSQANSLAGDPLIIDASAANSAVVISTAAGSWTFGSDGNLTFPNGDLTIGSDVYGAPAIIGAAGKNISMIASGVGDGYDIGSNLIWVDSITEPPTKIAGVVANNPLFVGAGDVGIVTGDYLYTGNTNVWNFGADGTTTVPGGITMPEETGLYSPGHDLYITAGNTTGCSVPGGDTIISSGLGYGGAANNGGNVTLRTGDYYNKIWNFDYNGALTIPGSIISTAGPAITFATTFDGNIAPEIHIKASKLTFIADSAYLNDIVDNTLPFNGVPAMSWNMEGEVLTWTANNEIFASTSIFKMPHSDSANVGVIAMTGPSGGSELSWHGGTDYGRPIGQFIKSSANVSISTNAGFNWWIFGDDGNLTLPAGGDIVDSNGDTVLGGGGSTGNIGFVTDYIYDFNGITLENADLTHGATAAVIVPANGNSTNPIHLNNLYGDVRVSSGIAGATKSWDFNGNGELVLPRFISTPTITTTAGGSIKIQPKIGNVDALTNAGHLYLYAGEADADHNAAGGNVHILATAKNGGGQDIIDGIVDITTAGGTWTFGADGKLTAPGKIQITDTTNSISTATGALIVGGGAGIRSDVHIGGTVRITDTTPSTDYSTGALVVDGGLGVNGNINLTGNINILNGNINIQEFTGSTGNFYGDVVTGFNAFYAGKSGFTALPYTVAQFSTTSNTYSQINMENTSTGKLASADFVGTADIGTDASWFFDIGIANSGYDPVLAAENNAPGTAIGPLDAYYYVQGNVDVPATGGNLAIGTSQTGKTVKIFAGGVNAADVVMTVAENGVVVTQNLTAPNLGYAADVAAANAAIVTANSAVVSYANTLNSAMSANVAAANAAVITANTAMKNYVDSRSSTYSNANVASYLVASSQTIGNASITGTTTFGTAMQIIGSTNTITTTNGSAVQFGQRANFNSINGVYSNGPFVAQSGTASTSTDTGAVRVSGGVGVSGNIYAGGNVTAPYFVGNTVGTTSTYSGNVTANKFVGDGSSLTNVTVSVAGNIQGSGTNVNLVAGSFTTTFDNTGVLTLPAQSITTGSEGAEIDFTKAPSSTLSGSVVVVDQYADRLRFFESGGTNRGVYIDFTQAAAGVGTLLNNRVSGLVNAGTFVTMDLIKATVTTSGQRGLSLATTTGTFTYNIGGTYGTAIPSSGGSSGSGTLSTTATASIFNWNFGSAGDTSTYILTDTTNSRAYRITLQIGSSYNNNMISIERLI